MTDDEGDEPRIRGYTGAVIGYSGSTRIAVQSLQDTKVLDTGTDYHVWNNSNKVKINKLAAPGDVIMAGDKLVAIEAYGTIRIPIKLSRSSNSKLLILDNIILAPTFFTSIISIGKLKQAKIEVNFWTNMIINYGNRLGVIREFEEILEGGHFILVMTSSLREH
jgi:hypothetical protein